ncbi:zinc finger protein 845 isoform X1 [Diachasma alloeum]|uniref:zinc finger protein 845 isoform X1 n=1 Tax=Diachasma alloeum TaxID=454923 RepID=UPI00073848D3|nr:zinc finger protein 845 isoform X1 [Diachasma alloeum]
MDEVVELEALDNVCRLCLSTDEPKSPIFGVQGAAVPLAEKIQDCLSIEVLRDDKLGTMICGSCVKSVNQWHLYRDSCLRSQEKLQRWVEKRGDVITHIKSEPIDPDEMSSPEDLIDTMDNMDDIPEDRSPPRSKRRRSSSHSSEADSVAGTQLLLNPMAAAAKDLLDPTSGDYHSSRKKLKRGPHTHFRGIKVFKRKCPHCMIHLHSKLSYKNHMDRYHRASAPKPRNGPLSFRLPSTDKSSSLDEDIEMVEDVEDELLSMEKNAPLTQVQENIISQLKTFSCYSCQQVFSDRRSTLNHIRQHMPDLRPYTCIACLTEFPDRSIYKLHCGASFECAMKIALVVPKHGTEKYFTCNMCLRPMPNRKELLSHLSKHSDKQYEPLTSSAPTALKSPKTKERSATAPGPYRHGDPAHNHTCDYCGMIYRYKPNMLKHEDLCKRLPPDERTSYRCAHCGMTFLVFKKFQSHITLEHNRKDLVCYECNSKFKQSNEYLIHHQQHRNSAVRDGAKSVWKNYNSSLTKVTMKYGCAMCPQEFLTKEELAQHRPTHSKTKSQAQNHVEVIDPDVDDSMSQSGSELNASAYSIPRENNSHTRSTECTTCGKIFANYPNLRRHIRTVHIIAGRFSCPKCPKTFTSEDLWNQHAERAHPKEVPAEGGAPPFKCMQCKKVFDSQEMLNSHLQQSHGMAEDDHLACDICGKRFSNETSLKIHRGHHFRRDSRLSIRSVPHPLDQVQVEMQEGPLELSLTPRPAKAKKSFPTPSFKQSLSPSNLACAVCDDSFSDVGELRKHLWEVHCQKHKSEKSFVGDLQCELCTNVFPDEKALEEHMRWHKENPILAEVTRPVDISCDICGKFYSSTKALWKHKKLHKTTPVAGIKFQSLKKTTPTSFPCPVCKKVFNNETSMKKHKAAAHYVRKSLNSITRKSTTPSPSKADEDGKPKRPKLDFDMIRKAYHLGEPSGSSFGTPTATTKKPVTCGICKKLLPSMSSLYKHRQNVHKSSIGKPLEVDEGEVEGEGVSCTECYKVFSNPANMKQHYTKVHGNGDKHYCTMDDCEEVFDTSLAKQAHEKSHMNILYSCNLCSRHMFNRSAIDGHLNNEHAEEVEGKKTEMFYRKTDLGSYEVKGADGRVCPICKIKYPNIKAMKIHYVKIHEGVS